MLPPATITMAVPEPCVASGLMSVWTRRTSNAPDPGSALTVVN
jgi:hypothetical protein